MPAAHASLRRSFQYGLAALGLVLGLAVAGCRPEPQAPLIPASNKDAPSFDTGSEDHLQLAMTFIDTVNEYSEAEIVARIGYHLQKWIQEREPDDDWVADPLFGRLPQRLRLVKGRAALSRLVFTESDVAMLREAMWLRNIAQQLSQRPVADAELTAWLEENEQTLGAEAVRDLGTTYELFDWVVRNIQQEPAAEANNIRYSKRMVWEAMLLGRGDIYVQSRMFILLARQLGIPVVMLAIDEDDGEPRPWLPAALIGGRLYLFDMQLGLPLPADGSRGIATLAQILDDPQQLEDFYDDDPLSAADLKRIVALIEASPEYLSQRMKLVELALTGTDKMRLTCRPSILSRELRKLPGIAHVAIWTMSYDSIQQRVALRNNPAALQQIQREIATLSGQSPIARGRLQHFRGQYAKEATKDGAKSHYMQSRPSDQQIVSISNADQEIQALLQARGLPDDPATRSQMTQILQQQLRDVKQLASYWLGILAFEKNQFKVAADFFEKRSLAAFPNGIFSAGAAYNLGRTYERWGRAEQDSDLLQQAIDAYQLDRDGALSKGNQIRSARLRQVIADLADPAT